MRQTEPMIKMFPLVVLVATCFASARELEVRVRPTAAGPQIHVDGKPVIVDPGTFTYHTHKDLRAYFAAQGETLSSAITRTEIFEPMFCSVIYVGEESGALDSILEKTSEYYEEESDSAVQRLVSMLEPILIIFMGVIIAMVVMGIYPALYGSFEAIENE